VAVAAVAPEWRVALRLAVAALAVAAVAPGVAWVVQAAAPRVVRTERVVVVVAGAAALGGDDGGAAWLASP
jgi:hypothetical protein